MAELRFKALQEVFSRQPREVVFASNKISDYFGIRVFDQQKMQKYLSKEAYESIKKAINKGTTIDRKLADQVAAGMRDWAIGMNLEIMED